MGPDKIPVEPPHGAYDDDLPDLGPGAGTLEPDYQAEERDEAEEEGTP